LAGKRSLTNKKGAKAPFLLFGAAIASRLAAAKRLKIERLIEREYWFFRNQRPKIMLSLLK
jgi:hypothetical protein